MGSLRSASTVAARSVTASVDVRGAEVDGEHDASRGVERELGRRSSAGRRGAGDGVTRPSCISASTRGATVDRASPVACARDARVRGTPSRRSWNSSLAPDVPAPSPADVDHPVSKAHPLGG